MQTIFLILTFLFCALFFIGITTYKVSTSKHIDDEWYFFFQDSKNYKLEEKKKIQ